MTNQDLYDNFDFIDETARKIADILNEDESNNDWINAILEEQESTGVFPEETFKRINDVLMKDHKDLLEDFRGIFYSNEDNSETLFNSIFYPQDEMIQEPIEDDNYIEEDEPEEDIYIESAMTPESLAKRQQSQIEQVSNTLFISNDLSYLLLKHYDWNADRLMQKWLDNPQVKNNILNSLHVPQEMVHEPLVLHPVGKGECEVCFNDDVELYQLYCGHILCEYCWKGEMTIQLDQGKSAVVCRIDGCGAEIAISDVAKFCGDEKAESFKQFILEDQISRDNKLIHCTAPGCDQVLTLDSVGLCNVATCSCGKRVCWRCQEDAHAPMKCEQKEEWKNIQEEMLKLSRAQNRWEAREFGLMEYRRTHMNEVHQVNAEYNKKLSAEHEEINRKELEEIKKLKEELSKCTDKLIRSAKETKIREKTNENKIKQQERKKERDTIIEEQNQFIQAIQSPQYAKFYMRQLKESQELRAMSKYCTTDEEFIERMTKKCPKCKTPIQKNGGCNYMRCSRCNFEFCWVCGADWKTHGDHFVCNKYDGKGGNAEGDDDEEIGPDEEKFDPEDKKYYLPPMNSDIRGKFARWNHYFRRYQGHKDAQKMEKGLREKCRQTMVNSWEEMSKQSANKLVDKVYAAIDLARSVLIYSYPTAYFMDMHSKAFHMFELYQSNLEISNEKLVGMVERFCGQSPDDFEKFSEMNEKYVDVLLREVDAFST